MGVEEEEGLGRPYACAGRGEGWLPAPTEEVHWMKKEPWELVWHILKGAVNCTLPRVGMGREAATAAAHLSWLTYRPTVGIAFTDVYTTK